MRSNRRLTDAERKAIVTERSDTRDAYDQAKRCNSDNRRWALRDSNPRRLACKASALPTELSARRGAERTGCIEVLFRAHHYTGASQRFGGDTLAGHENSAE
jgi:hypothetical protein